MSNWTRLFGSTSVACRYWFVVLGLADLHGGQPGGHHQKQVIFGNAEGRRTIAGKHKAEGAKKAAHCAA